MLGRPVLNILARESDPAADDALLAALPTADSITAQAVVEILLARGQPAGLRGLVEHLHRFDEPIRQIVLACGPQLASVLHDTFQTRAERVRLNVTEVIRGARLYRACYILETAMQDRAAAVREAGVQALYGLADALLTEPRTDAAQPADTAPQQVGRRMAELQARHKDRSQVTAALATGLGVFNLHLQPLLVEAAMWLADDLGAKL